MPELPDGQSPPANLKSATKNLLEHRGPWCLARTGLSTLSIPQPFLDFRFPPGDTIHRQPTPLRKLARAFHAPHRRSTQADSLSDLSKRNEPRKTGPAVWCRRCCRGSRHLRRRSLGWQAPQYVQQFGRLLMKIDQSPHVVLEAKHHFIASAVQLVNSSDQFVTFAGEAFALTRKPLRLFDWR